MLSENGVAANLFAELGQMVLSAADFLVIALNRVLTGADTITAVQQVGECTSSTGFHASARNPRADKDEG